MTDVPVGVRQKQIAQGECTCDTPDERKIRCRTVIRRSEKIMTAGLYIERKGGKHTMARQVPYEHGVSIPQTVFAVIHHLPLLEAFARIFPPGLDEWKIPLGKRRSVGSGDVVLFQVCFVFVASRSFDSVFHLGIFIFDAYTSSPEKYPENEDTASAHKRNINSALQETSAPHHHRVLGLKAYAPDFTLGQMKGRRFQQAS